MVGTEKSLPPSMDDGKQHKSAAPETAESLEAIIKDLLERKDKQLEIVKIFKDKEQLTRSDVARLKFVIQAYDSLLDIQSELAFSQMKWIPLSKKTVKELETEKHELSPVVFDEKMDAFDADFDKLKEKFKVMLESFPDNEVVVDLLKTFQPKPKEVEVSFDTKSNSGSGKGAAINKVPKMKDDITKEFTRVLEESELGAGSTQSVSSLLLSLNRMAKILDVEGKFDKYLQDLENAEDAKEFEIAKYETWQNEYVLKIANLQEQLNLRVKPDATNQQKQNSFQTFFKKMHPPKFDGDCLEYVEFKTKWKSQVSSCPMPAEMELDRLKENLPDQAKKNLFDVNSLSIAWDILDKLYQDTNLITQKLKNRMKNLQVKSSEPHEMIIEIHQEVDYLVKRLVKMKAQDLLKTDNDYLNAIYSKLPLSTQEKWDDYELKEDETEWKAFSIFLYEKYQAALRKRTRMESLKQMPSTESNKDKSEKVKGSFDPKVDNSKEVKCYKCSGIGHKSKECPNKTKSVVKESPKVTAGKTDVEVSDKKNDCPCCKKYHTWKPKNKPKPIRSTRLSSCPDFEKLDINARGEFLESVKGCTLCLSWLHDKDKCTARISNAKCLEKIDGDGKICNQLHSTLLHGCAVPYCQVAKTQVVTDSASKSSPEIDEYVSTLGLLQDVPTGNDVARVQWDGGANKVLITHSYAKKAGLEEVPAKYYMQVVGEGWKKVEGVMYIFDMISNKGKKMRMWGYGIDRITDPVSPVDLSEIRHLFPHVPDIAFKSLEEKPLDILVGLNFLGLHPEGGTGFDKVGNLKALKSEFSHGWVIAGSHPKLKPCKINLTTQASIMATLSRVEITPQTYKDFLELENLGIEPPKRCQRCKMCKFCSDEGLTLSCQEEEELKLIDDGVTVQDGRTYIKYPFIKDPNMLSDEQSLK